MATSPQPTSDARVEIDPSRMLVRVLRIYRDRARTLVPMALIVGGVSATVQGPRTLSLFAATLGAVVLDALFHGVAVQIVQDAQSTDRERSLPTLARSVTRAVLPFVVLLAAVALATVIGVVLLLSAFAQSALSPSGPGVTVAVVVAALLFVLVLVLVTRWAVVVPVAVIEHRGVVAAFRRSRALVRGSGWNVLATLALVFLVVTGATFAVALLVGGLSPAARTAALAALTLPISALAPPVLYFALLDASPARDAAPSSAPAGANPASARARLTKGTRGRLALWIVLTSLWFLLLANYLTAAPHPRHPSVAGAVFWAAVLVSLLGCCWVTWRRLRAASTREG